jgi:farnesyl-diphosphate farnesyltransferase
MFKDRAYKFCIAILPQVSRTFAINIRVLRGDLYRAVLCAYLFCRVVDTVEDSEPLSLETRNRLLDEYIAVFTEGDYCDQRYQSLIDLFGRFDNDNPEHLLMQNIALVFQTFLTLPVLERKAIEECVIEMARGMKVTINRQRREGSRLYALETMADLEQYCYYVAGTVGILLTKLFTHHAKSMSPESIAKARELQLSFALGLQLTNIIKDCHDDYRRGWCYIPADLSAQCGITTNDFLNPTFRQNSLQALNTLITKTAHCLDDALAYTLLFPRRAVRIRLFNLWSLFFAIKTLGRAWNYVDLLTGEQKVKISRFEVYQTLLLTTLVCGSNSLLRRAYRRLRKAIP